MTQKGAKDVKGTKMAVYNTNNIETVNWAVASTGLPANFNGKTVSFSSFS